jgi:predicted O-methyltransferase YrrM
MNLEERFNRMLSCTDGFMEWKTNRLDLLNGYFTCYALQMTNSLESELVKSQPKVMIDTRDHLEFLRSIGQGNILEIGTEVGNTATAFLLGVEKSGGTVTSIDINSQWSKNFPDHPQWTFILGDSKSEEVKEQLHGRIFDILYVDGDHSYEGTKNDISFYSKLIHSGGLILVHDVLATFFPGVRQAFDEADFKQKTIREGSWGLGVIQKE